MSSEILGEKLFTAITSGFPYVSVPVLSKAISTEFIN